MSTPTSRHATSLWLMVAIALGLCTSSCQMDSHSSESSGAGSAASDSAAAQVTIGDIRWYVDYDAALALARAQDKALWVHFGENPG